MYLYGTGVSPGEKNALIEYLNFIGAVSLTRRLKNVTWHSTLALGYRDFTQDILSEALIVNGIPEDKIPQR